MKSSNTFFKILMFLSILLCMQNVKADYFTTANMHGKSLQLSVRGTLTNNGNLVGTESANLSCDTFSGKGILNSPQISIKTNVFAYTGKIHCSGKCTIIASKPFNKKMFKRSGGGEFIIIIDENQDSKTSK